LAGTAILLTPFLNPLLWLANILLPSDALAQMSHGHPPLLALCLLIAPGYFALRENMIVLPLAIPHSLLSQIADSVSLSVSVI